MAQYLHTSYDPLGRIAWTSLQSTAQAPAGVAATLKTSFTYHPDGSIRQKTDAPNDVTVTSTTDVSGEVATRTEHGETLSFEYWPDGSLKKRSSTDADVSTVEYEYDHEGAVRTIASDAEVLSYDLRDGTGLPLKVTGFDGQAASYAYDHAGRPVGRRFAGKDLVYSYGGGGSGSDGLITGIQLRTFAASPVAEVAATFAYDDTQTAGRFIKMKAGRLDWQHRHSKKERTNLERKFAKHGSKFGAKSIAQWRAKLTAILRDHRTVTTLQYVASQKRMVYVHRRGRVRIWVTQGGGFITAFKKG